MLKWVNGLAAVAGLLWVACAPADDFGSDTQAHQDLVGPWSCSGVVGKNQPADGGYYVTSFGCWIDENGNKRGDPSDNCIPWCESGAAQHGTQDEYDALCGSMSGPECERAVQWFAADADRFGCMRRLRVTNERNGKSAVVVVLDRGPHCSIERRVGHWVIDLSYPASYYLFGEPKAATERGEVKVVPVPDDTPLGPWTGPGDDDEEEPVAVVVDSNNNHNPMGAACLVSGDWVPSDAVPGYYNTGYWRRPTGPTSDPVQFSFALDRSRRLGVDAWWPASPDHTDRAPFLIYDGDVLLDTVYVDQRQRGGQWVELGEYAFSRTARVDVSMWTTPGAFVVADAVRFRSR